MSQRNEVTPTPTQGPVPLQQPTTTTTTNAPTMRTIFKILLHEGEKNLTDVRRLKTAMEQMEKRITNNNKLIRRCKDMDQPTKS